jgi:pyruvate carboxylase
MIKLVSIGQEVDGVKHIVLSVNNTMHVFPVEMPSRKAAQKAGPRFADPTVSGQIASPIMGNVWRIGDKDRILKIGDIVKEGEEIVNIEAMKVETAVLSPIHGVIKEIAVKLNEAIVEKQLLMVLEEVPPEERKRSRTRSKNSKKAR